MLTNDLPDGCEKVSDLLDAELPGRPLRFRYKNWEGKIANRHVLPRLLFLGRSKWHPEPQVLMLAHDLDRDAPRCFAVSDILEFLPTDAPKAVEAEPIPAGPPPEPVQSKVRLFQDPGTGRLVHNGHPSWRATRQGVQDVDGQPIAVDNAEKETFYRLPSGEAIGAVSHLAGAWTVLLTHFEFWGPSKKLGRDTYMPHAITSSREEGETYLTTVLRQAGATLP